MDFLEYYLIWSMFGMGILLALALGWFMAKSKYQFLRQFKGKINEEKG